MSSDVSQLTIDKQKRPPVQATLSETLAGYRANGLTVHAVFECLGDCHFDNLIGFLLDLLQGVTLFPARYNPVCLVPLG